MMIYDYITSHTVNVNIKMDEDVKKRMERACAEMGLSMSAAFTTVSYTHLHYDAGDLCEEMRDI